MFNNNVPVVQPSWTSKNILMLEPISNPMDLFYMLLALRHLFLSRLKNIFIYCSVYSIRMFSQCYL